MVEYIVAIDLARVRFPADAFQPGGKQFGIPSNLLHMLQTKTHRMAVFVDHCAEVMLTEVVLRHLASDMRSPDSSEHEDPVCRCWRTARRPSRCSASGESFHQPFARRSGMVRDGTGASLANSAEAFWLPFPLSGSAWFCILGKAHSTIRNNPTEAIIHEVLRRHVSPWEPNIGESALRTGR